MSRERPRARTYARTQLRKMPVHSLRASPRTELLVVFAYTFIRRRAFHCTSFDLHTHRTCNDYALLQAVQKVESW